MSFQKIALAGRMRSGKNKVADIIEWKYGHKQFQLGDHIGALIIRYFPEALLEGKPRKHYQVIGQAFRELDPDIWVKLLLENPDLQYQPPDRNFIITDVRQENEVRLLREEGFTVIKIEAAEEIRKQRIEAAGDVYDEEAFNHETEVSVDTLPYDYLITNNGTSEELFSQIQTIMKELRGRK